MNFWRSLLLIPCVAVSSLAAAGPTRCSPGYQDSSCVGVLLNAPQTAPTCSTAYGWQTVTPAAWQGSKYSTPVCSYTAPPTCPGGFDPSSTPTWNGSSWVGLTCTPHVTPPPPVGSLKYLILLTAEVAYTDNYQGWVCYSKYQILDSSSKTVSATPTTVCTDANNSQFGWSTPDITDTNVTFSTVRWGNGTTDAPFVATMPEIGTPPVLAGMPAHLVNEQYPGTLVGNWMPNGLQYGSSLGCVAADGWKTNDTSYGAWNTFSSSAVLNSGQGVGQGIYHYFKGVYFAMACPAGVDLSYSFPLPQ